MREFELLSLDGFDSWLKRKKQFTLHPGQKCLNCDTELAGRYCHVCSQDADTHHRSILHLIWEAIEGLFHLDGRLWRTLPGLFFRPGTLARDYIEGRIIRHVPPFRTFLVALLLFIFAAEHVVHTVQHEAQHGAAHSPDAQHKMTPQEDSKAFEAAKSTILAKAEADLKANRADAQAYYEAALAQAGTDAEKAKAKTEYDQMMANIQADYDSTVADAPKDARKAMLGPFNFMALTPEQRAYIKSNINEGSDHASGGTKQGGDSKAKILKALDNPQLFFLQVFTIGHRLAVLMLPIMTAGLTLIYAYRRKYFIYDHFLVATNLLSFTFLTNALGFVLPQVVQMWWFLLLMIWTPVNIFMTLRGGYQSSIAGAIGKTLILWLLTMISFATLVVCLTLMALEAI